MYEFWYDYVKRKYGERAKLCYMHTDGFIVIIKTEKIYADIAKGVETRFYTSDYELDRSLLEGNNKKAIRLMKDEIVGKVMKEFAALRPKTCNYLTDNNDKDKKAKA